MESALAVLLIILVLPFVFTTIGPLNLTVAVHFVVLPVALILPILTPNIFAYIIQYAYLCHESNC